jgi:hypothetical protein
MKSPRYAPAGLLVEFGAHRVMLDGGPGAEPEGILNAWLVTDERGELMRDIRALGPRQRLRALRRSLFIRQGRPGTLSFIRDIRPMVTS